MSETPKKIRSESPIPLRRLAGAGVGQTIEWFDWTAYAILAVYFADQFFPESASGLTALLGTFGILAVGFIVRPLAGLIVGALADHFGRMFALMLTIYGMGISSLVIALAPTYEQVGVLAPIILLLARIVQGISIGGEFASVTAYAMEAAAPGRRGLVAGFAHAFGFAGQAAVIGVVTIVATLLDDQQMEQWGWRLVFLIGAALTIVGYFMRRHITDTLDPRETETKMTWSSITRPMREYPRQTFQVIGLTAGFTAMVYAWGTYFPTYANTYHGLDLDRSLLALFIVNVFCIIVVPFTGMVSDRFGRKIVMSCAGLALTLITIPALGMLNDSFVRLISIQLLGNFFILFLQSSSIAAYAELFPKKFRAAGFGFPYSLTVGLVGGTIPMVGTQFVNVGLPQIFPWYLVILIGISTVFYMTMKETAFKPLPE